MMLVFLHNRSKKQRREKKAKPLRQRQPQQQQQQWSRKKTVVNHSKGKRSQAKSRVAWISGLITMIKVMQLNDWSDNNLCADLQKANESQAKTQREEKKKNKRKQQQQNHTTAWPIRIRKRMDSCIRITAHNCRNQWRNIKPTILCVFIILKCRIYTKLNHKKKRREREKEHGNKNETKP